MVRKHEFTILWPTDDIYISLDLTCRHIPLVLLDLASHRLAFRGDISARPILCRRHYVCFWEVDRQLYHANRSAISYGDYKLADY
jgi:hypothetical protein